MTTVGGREHRWHPQFDERGVRRRLRETARGLLAGYLSLVATALRNEGLTVTDRWIGDGPDLEAGLTTTPTDPTRRALPAPIELTWAEDTGWSVSHRLLGRATPWRYLHTSLVPSPEAVARFVRLLVTGAEDLGMAYPAQFRFRSHPLQPVLDELARHAVPANEGRTERHDIDEGARRGRWTSELSEGAREPL